MTTCSRPPIATTNPAYVLVEVPSACGDSEPSLRLEVARFPATVAEYRAFILDGGYENSQWWSGQGWSWRSLHAIVTPRYWDQPGYADPDEPVTGISLWEAEAYAKYRRAELPNEAEWYAIASDGGNLLLPWGDADQEPSAERANLTFFGEFGTSRRVSVRSSSRGESPSGVCDLIGNVGEWCLPGAAREVAAEATTAVLRGGATWHVPGVADSSFRDVVSATVRDNHTGIRLVRRLPQHPHQAPPTAIGWPAPRRRLGRSIRRPTAPFRQEGIPTDLSATSWRLHVRGGSIGDRRFSLDELRRDFPVTSVGGLFVCVCRWGEHNRFTGVLLRDLLAAWDLPPTSWNGLYLKQRSIAGPSGVVYETTVPLTPALEHKALLAWAMDGKELTPELGWPLRFIDFHRYGYKGVKALAELEVTDQAQAGWWERACQYDVDGTILPGTITVVGEEAARLDIEQPGRVACDDTLAPPPKAV